jgi:hypothetical protein
LLCCNTIDNLTGATEGRKNEMEVHFKIRLLEFQYDAHTMSVEFRFQFVKLIVT